MVDTKDRCDAEDLDERERGANLESNLVSGAPPVLQAHEISRSVIQGDSPLEILHQVNISVNHGEILCLMGPSGSGKSSLLQILGLLDAPTAGEVIIDGERVDFSRESALIKLRRRKIGFLFQNHNLLPGLTAVDNVALPLILLGKSRGEAEARALELLERVGLAHRANFRAVKLSGGESQRVALARAVVHSPSILIADEPTGSLDRYNGEIVLELLKAHSASSTTPTAVIVATHSDEVEAIAHRTVFLRDGYLSPRNQTEDKAPRNSLRDGRQCAASSPAENPSK
jgi:ABC-type lipoprotein export system ATPase subunit